MVMVRESPSASSATVGAMRSMNSGTAAKSSRLKSRNAAQESKGTTPAHGVSDERARTPCECGPG